MIWLNPESVSFGSLVLSDVESVTVDRQAVLTAEEFGDSGPFMVFADVPRCRVRVRVVRRVLEAGLIVPVLGALGPLVFTPTRNASSANRLTVTLSMAVVTSLTHSVNRSGASRQTVDFVALSSDGSKDPIVQSDK